MDNEFNDSSAPDSSQKVWTVSEVNRLIKDVLEQTFYPFWLRGEISNMTIHRSGHVYFCLKDARSQLSGVYFRGAVAARQMQLKDGADIEVWGRLTVYEPRGTYQLIADRIRTRGVGTLQQRFDELKQKLRDEGLFDAERKRPVPVLPSCVGVVTSPEGAAIHDFLRTLGRRFADVHVRIYPAAVQGNLAAAQIAEGIRFFNKKKACDVIVVTRGGGSLEDLWPFNEETVARAVAESAIPVISAVGHEVDFTICDYVADLRVSTPSAAAELVVGRKSEMLETVQVLRRRLADQLLLRMAALRRRMDKTVRHAVFREPQNLIRLYQQRVDELALRLASSVQTLFERKQSKYHMIEAKIHALDPRNVLKRGYAILTHSVTGRVITVPAQVSPGDVVVGEVAGGTMKFEVSRQEQNP